MKAIYENQNFIVIKKEEGDSTVSEDYFTSKVEIYFSCEFCMHGASSLIGNTESPIVQCPDCGKTYKTEELKDIYFYSNKIDSYFTGIECDKEDEENYNNLRSMNRW